MSDQTFNLDPMLLDQVNNASFSQRSGGLPFPTRYFYVINGDARMANGGVPAMFFGGFATDKAEWDGFTQQQNLSPLGGLTPGTIAGRDSNGTVDIYTTRSLYIAPVAARTGYLIDNGKRRVARWQAGARKHVQMLVVLGNKDEAGNIVIYSPAVITAKGFQANNLMGAVDAWQKHTAAIRSTEAPGVPAWLFWLAIGTFGAQCTVEMVGGQQKSPITPIKPYLPEPMTREILAKTYGGEKLARLIVELREKSQEWVSAWDTNETTEDPAPRGHANAPHFPAGSVSNMAGDDTIF